MIDLKCGDCLELMKEIPDNSIDISFTSPPYNRKRNDKYQNYDDTVEDYFRFLCNFTEHLLRITKKYIFINIQKNYYNKKEVFEYIGEYADKITEIVLSNSPLKSNTTYTKNIISSSVNSNTTLKTHKAVMKQEISDYFIEKFTSKNDVIIDPFMGTGTTGVSCKKLNRNFIGFEIDKEYFNIAKKRIEEVENE